MGTCQPWTLRPMSTQVPVNRDTISAVFACVCPCLCLLWPFCCSGCQSCQSLLTIPLPTRSLAYAGLQRLLPQLPAGQAAEVLQTLSQQLAAVKAFSGRVASPSSLSLLQCLGALAANPGLRVTAPGKPALLDEGLLCTWIQVRLLQSMAPLPATCCTLQPWCLAWQADTRATSAMPHKC